MNKKAKAILDFWFIKTSPEERFNRNDEFDKKIKDLKFKDYYENYNKYLRVININEFKKIF